MVDGDRNYQAAILVAEDVADFETTIKGSAVEVAAIEDVVALAPLGLTPPVPIVLNSILDPI